jgi:F0F1-type ATP synthase membrane subunit c/vacuolar-type H+-ATPase subunit K
MIAQTAIFLQSVALIGTLILAITGVAIGQLRIGRAILTAHDMQPQIQPTLTKTTVIAMGISETACILALTFIIIILFKQTLTGDALIFSSIAYSGVIFALGVTGFVVSLCSSFPAANAAYASAQQPFFANKILNVMLITMSIIQTPAIFGFVIMLLISLQAPLLTTLNDALKLLAAAFCTGCGAIGPVIGQGLFAKSACYIVGTNRKTYARILTFALLSQTLIETPIIIALLVALLLLNVTHPSNLKLIALMMASLCQSISNFFPGISSGRTAATACRQLGLAGTNAAAITGASLLAQGFLDTFAIYGLLISILLIYST